MEQPKYRFEDLHLQSDKNYTDINDTIVGFLFDRDIIVPFDIQRKLDDIIHFIRREMLDFTAFPVFFVSNLLLVQCKKYYFNRATVSRNCSIVL